VPKPAPLTGEVVMKLRPFVWMLAGGAAVVGTVAVINWPDIMRYVRMHEM
jgi:hypothetical protein